MALILRDWQAKSVECLVAKAKAGQKRFFCLAATATGKTVMAAESAKRLMAMDKVDIVIAFCPSNEIQLGIRRTFGRHIEHTFDGSIDAKGSVHTYQGMLTLNASFWDLFEKYRVMVVFDEIHHCAGTEFSRKNSWGSQILDYIKEKAAFVLCLSGTPWRSDRLPITVACYDHNEKIACDYQYGLADAVRDQVCRNPSLVLMDNDNISVSVHSETRSFSSLAEAIKESPLDYLKVIRDPKAQKYLISQAVNKLREIRKVNASAGGIVVASSVEHAEELVSLLRCQFKEEAWIVSYLHPKAQQTIDKFRRSDVPWIVSVGMISEGTDVPRSQVCCHLSHIRTEMHFRQTLGRILRITDDENQEAWLYTFAESNLSLYAKRLKTDLPEARVNFEKMQEKEDNAEEGNHVEQSNNSSTSGNALGFDLSGEDLQKLNESEGRSNPLENEEEEQIMMHFEFNEASFIEQLVGLYDIEEQLGS